MVKNGKHTNWKPAQIKVLCKNVFHFWTERITMNGRPPEPKYARNKNVLVVGGSGSGKTRFFIKPNALQMNSSLVITDPMAFD